METQTQEQEMQSLLADVRAGWGQLSGLPEQFTRLEKDLKEIRRGLLATRIPRQRSAVAAPGEVSDDCASYFAANFICHVERCGMLEALAESGVERDALVRSAREVLGVATKTALGTADVPLPSVFGSEIRELISTFGIARKVMSPYPITRGTCRPARMGARPAFGSIAMSAGFTEKSPTMTFASLESHKVGGIVRVPRELDEQSIVPLGRFLARYGAVEFARLEDQWAFLADGNATFENIKGVVQVAKDATKTVVLASTKTKPSDATLDDFRSMRRMVNKAALNGRLSAYYLDTTWETRLPAFKNVAEPDVYRRLPDGSAVLDGYPIVWTDVLEPYGTAAAADKAIAVFGALSFWWFGEHGNPRMDTSAHVHFQNDQLAVRFIEEIDFDYMANDATSALLTAAS